MGEAKKPGSIRAKAHEPEAFMLSAIGREVSLSFRVPKLSGLYLEGSRALNTGAVEVNRGRKTLGPKDSDRVSGSSHAGGHHWAWPLVCFQPRLVSVTCNQES